MSPKLDSKPEATDYGVPSSKRSMVVVMQMPVDENIGGHFCAVCNVAGLGPHKVVFDHIAVGVTRANNALRE